MALLAAALLLFNNNSSALKSHALIGGRLFAMFIMFDFIPVRFILRNTNVKKFATGKLRPFFTV